MQSKVSLQWALLIVGIVGVAFLSTAFSSVNRGETPEDVPAGVKTTESTLPVRLKIPKINVDAAIEYVGLASDGSMDVPKNPDEVAWFESGARPGENGNAVIAGHYGWKDGKPAVFDTLHTLRKGDRVYIENEKGVTVSFVVRESRRYDPKADASDVFRSSDGQAHLNLITCEGVWNTAEKSYSDRLVVFTDRLN